MKHPVLQHPVRTLGLALGLLLPGPAAWADVFSVPLVDGQTWHFLETGSRQNSDGSSESWGPVPVDIHFQAVNLTLGTHAVDFSASNGWYLMSSPLGPLQVLETEPGVAGEYEYFIEPKPFLFLTLPLNPGDSVSYSGTRQGQWVSPGGGFEAWSGTWSQTFTHLGQEQVTTPLGTFSALKLGVESLDFVLQRAQFPNGRETGQWSEVRWFVPNLGYVQVAGSGTYSSDNNGDNVVDRWQFEQLTMVAVPEPAPAALLAAGLLALAFLGSGVSTRRA